MNTVFAEAAVKTPALDDADETSIAQVSYAQETLYRLRKSLVLWRKTDFLEAPDTILKSCGVISEPHTTDNGVHEAAEIDGTTLTGYRPPFYGRAALVQMPSGRFVDLKGIGLAPGRTPVPDVHKTGLLPLNKALEEVVRERIVRHFIRLSQLNISLVNTLSIIQTEIRSRDRKKAELPNVILVREACHRSEGNYEIDPFGSKRFLFCIALEHEMRTFGISSSGAQTKYRVGIDENKNGYIKRGWSAPKDHSNEEIDAFAKEFGSVYGLPFVGDYPNIQTTKSIHPELRYGRLVDFGQYGVYPGEFKRPVVLSASDKPFFIGNILWPDGSGWFRPDPSRRFDPTEAPVLLPPEGVAWFGTDPAGPIPEIKALAILAARALDLDLHSPNDVFGLLRDYADAKALRMPELWKDRAQQLRLPDLPPTH